MCPALAGGFLTTAPPGKSPRFCFLIQFDNFYILIRTFSSLTFNIIIDIFCFISIIIIFAFFLFLLLYVLFSLISCHILDLFYY